MNVGKRTLVSILLILVLVLSGCGSGNVGTAQQSMTSSGITSGGTATTVEGKYWLYRAIENGEEVDESYWNQAGQEYSLTFNSDGTGFMFAGVNDDDDRMGFTWTQNGSKITIKAMYEYEWDTPSFTLTLDGDTLDLEDSGFSYYYRKR